MVGKYTRAVGTNMLDEIKKIWFISLIILQVIFIAFYSFSIYTNIDRLIFLITYSILFGLSIISFILFLVNHKKRKKLNKVYKKAKNYLKYVVNATMLVVNIIEMVKYGASDFNKILLIVSGISLIIQLILEGITSFAERYFRDFNIAIEKDFGFLNPKRLASTALKVVDAPLKKIAEIKTPEFKVVKKEDKILEKHIKKFDDKAEERELAKKEKKAEKRKEELQRVKDEFKQIGSHIKSIFSKKKDPETKE